MTRRPASAGSADRDRQAVPERAARDLDAGDEHGVGMMAERRVEAAEARQLGDRDEPLGGEHGVVRRRPVPLRQQEPVVRLEDAVVEHPVDIEGRERARVVLLVAGQQREKGGQVVVSEGRRRSPCTDATISTTLEVKGEATMTSGELSDRSGRVALGAALLRGQGLIAAVRSDGNQRRYERSVLRRVALDPGGQRRGHPAGADPRGARALPADAAAVEARLGRLSRAWRSDLEQRIELLERSATTSRPASAAAASR